ncbi:Hypothetical predicted protein [Pelobates cultripes]|uniref:Uncharacterized protein n=1 Tax=Pelobates cultripes TaxID=61616 RepID=A0AAD1RWF3_PELCU|nr:Hypothetical predicted protein [Pelobates cultripes]
MEGTACISNFREACLDSETRLNVLFDEFLRHMESSASKCHQSDVPHGSRAQHCRQTPTVPLKKENGTKTQVHSNMEEVLRQAQHREAEHKSPTAQLVKRLYPTLLQVPDSLMGTQLDPSPNAVLKVL